MSSTSPAVGRALDVLLYLAGKSGPVSGAAIVRDLEDPALVDLPPARRADRARLRRALPRPAHLRARAWRRSRSGRPTCATSRWSCSPARCCGASSPRWARPRTSASCTAPRRLYLLKEQPAVARIPVTLVTDVGVRLPAHLTANGRSILAHLPAAQVRALFPSARGFVDRTGRGPGHAARAAAGAGRGAAAAVGRGDRPRHCGAAVRGGLRLRPLGPPLRRDQRDVAPGPHPGLARRSWCARSARPRSS